jgi:hypothetical protein
MFTSTFSALGGNDRIVETLLATAEAQIYLNTTISEVVFCASLQPNTSRDFKTV